MVATALAEPLDKPSLWAVGVFFGSYAETQYGATHARGDDVTSLVTPYSGMRFTPTPVGAMNFL